ncbi:hypothetical protein PsYK624_148980 [Phanerochaete sordida]|uniref:Uncharacterized protein n=1 Tax=Phanerochaete sordida TaxID=48140 RepID=A0A9P3GPE8_9APHY|nr:hypothetical protein PsYK624_148980 [Phanerochaete sordida]
MLWPWDRRDAESGLPGEGAYDYGRFGAPSNEQKEQKDRVDGELPDPRFTGRSYAERQLANGLYDIPITASPFRPVPLPHMETIPDLAPELGLLQVANYVPGDMSSDDGSRANSRQGVIGDVQPQPTASPAEQWSVYGPDDGFKNPWSPLRVKSREGLGIVAEKDVTDAPAEDEAPKAEEHVGPPAPQDSWAASFRSNIAHAFQAVVGSASRASLASTTHAHDTDGQQTAPAENPFDDPTSSMISLPGVEVTSDDPTPRCTECLSPNDTAVIAPSGEPQCLCEWLKQKQLPLPPSMQSHTHLAVPSPAPPSPHAVSPLSRYSPSGSAQGSPGTFALPRIPTSRRGSQSSLQEAIDVKRLHRGRSKRAMGTPRTPRTPRPTTTPLVRAASTCTVGSDMSRCDSTASTSSGPLSDQEQFAVRLLKERRKRVADSQRTAARQSLSRPSVRLGSKRRRKTGPRTPETEESVV